MPREAAFLLQPLSQNIRERLQMARVVPRVVFHPLRQRSLRPIRFLRTFFQWHAEKIAHEICEAEFFFAEQTRGEHRVENLFGNKIVVLSQQPQIVIGRMKNQFVVARLRPQWREINHGERIDQVVRASDADLEQAKFFRIGVKTIRFGIERDPFRPAQPHHEFRQFYVRIDHR